ncbi:MAG: HEAT repeat domain-containing protein [Dehalococcoidia bacterium]
MSLESYLKELADVKSALVISRLTGLSAIIPADLELLTKSWPGIAAERRREVIGDLITLAEGDPQLDYNDIFMLGMKDTDETVRLKSIEGLWEYEHRSLIDPLISILRSDASEQARASAAVSLGKFALLYELGKLRQKDGDRVEKSLITTTRNDKETIEVRRRAVEALAPLSLPIVTDVISEAYKNSNALMKASALYAMGINSDPAWQPILIHELNNTDPEIRFEAAKACGEFEDSQAVPQLLKLLKDPDSQVKLSVISALGKIGGDEAEAALEECMKLPEDYIRDAANDALRELYFNRDPFSIDSL